MQSAASLIYRAALEPETWPDALEAVARASGSRGAACLILNRQSRNVEWINVSSGYAEGVSRDYLMHFGKIDPYVRKLYDLPLGKWRRLSECIAPEDLRRDEWYRDFVVRNGVVDMSSASVAEVGSRAFLLGVHEGIGQRAIDPMKSKALLASQPAFAAAGHALLELRHLRSTGYILGAAAERLNAGVIICDPESRIIDIDGPAERLLDRGDVLTAKNGRVTARRAFETTRLALLIAGAGRSVLPSSGRMLLRGDGAGIPIFIIVMPLAPEQSPSAAPAAIVLISGIGSSSHSEDQIAELLGLSRAEARLAAALAQGLTLAEIAQARAVKVPTLRSQLSSILKKLNIRRQSDLIRLMAAIPAEE